MARNGSGVYSLPPGSTITNGDTSDATDLNTPLTDIETDMNTARPVVAGGTGSTSAGAARTALGVAIGSDVQAYDAGLASIAGLTTAADKMIYTTALDTYAVADLTAAGLALLDDASASAQRTTLGLGGLATLNILDEDNFATDSATRPPSQQSTAAYIATQIAAIPSSGMEFISQAVASGDATLDFTDFDASEYTDYIFVISGIVPSGDNKHFYMRTSTDGGSTYDSGGSDYETSGVSDSKISIALAVGSATNESGVSAVLTLHNPAATTYTPVTWTGCYVNTSGAYSQMNDAGARLSAADVDAVQFFYGSSTVESGTITMYGMRKS